MRLSELQGDPVPTAFHRLYLAMGRQEADLHPAPPTAAETAAKKDKDKDKTSSVDDAGVRRPDVDDGAWHAVTSTLWGMLGQSMPYGWATALVMKRH